MNRDDALKKIRKCLALGRSAETHEAAAAMRQAQKLMAEFSVSDRELSMIDVAEARVKASSAALNQWESALSHIVAGAFGCEVFSEVSGSYDSAGNWQRRRTYVFVGLEAAPTVAGYAFEVLDRQCVKARLQHIAKQPKRCKPITKTVRGDTFASGWVAAVADLVERFAQPERNEVLLLAYLEAKHPGLKKAKARDAGKGRRTDYGHRLAGYMAGQSAELHRGMAGAEERRLLA